MCAKRVCRKVWHSRPRLCVLPVSNAARVLYGPSTREFNLHLVCCKASNIMLYPMANNFRTAEGGCATHFRSSSGLRICASPCSGTHRGAAALCSFVSRRALLYSLKPDGGGVISGVTCATEKARLLFVQAEQVLAPQSPCGRNLQEFPDGRRRYHLHRMSLWRSFSRAQDRIARLGLPEAGMPTLRAQIRSVAGRVSAAAVAGSRSGSIADCFQLSRVHVCAGPGVLLFFLHNP